VFVRETKRQTDRERESVCVREREREREKRYRNELAGRYVSSDVVYTHTHTVSRMGTCTPITYYVCMHIHTHMYAHTYM